MSIHERNARAEEFIAAQRIVDTHADTPLSLIVEMSDRSITEVLTAVATLRPEAAGDVFVPPQPRTGPVGELPIRAVTLNDARVIAAAMRGYMELADTLRDALGTSGIDADVRDRLERVILELDCPS